MKRLVFLSLLMFSLIAFSQEEKPCQQLPIASPEVVANFGDDLAPLIEEKMEEALDLKPAREGIIKLVVNCDGTIKAFTPQDENLFKADIKAIRESVQEITWTPAMNKGREVTSTYFLKVSFAADGRVSVVKA